MRRRDLLRAAGAAIASPTFIRRLVAQPLLGSRAAVVIGVNKAGDLPVLRAAASGAHQVADWLIKNGFEVTRIVDDNGPVRAIDVQDVITKLVTRGTLEQLVIYFAGHGFLNAGRNEIWMLSGAPTNSSEAINVDSSIYEARETGIRNVVFVSDACRSTPDSLKISRVQGYVVFPNLGVSRPIRPEVDRFFAALPGDPSYEVHVSESVRKWEGIYTAALLGAFENPDDKMVRTIHGHRVIPNRMLKPYLWTEVPKRAQAKKIILNQVPETIVESDETTYIGRVYAAKAKKAHLKDAFLKSPAILTYTAQAQLNSVGANFRTDLEIPPHLKAMPAADFISWQSLAGQEEPAPFLASYPGITVLGAELERVATNPRMQARQLNNHVRIQMNGQRAGSVVLQFKGGNGTVVVAIPDFVATVQIENGRVANVNYSPTPQGARWSKYFPVSKSRQEFRATIAATARAGMFRIEGDRETRTRKAAELTNLIQSPYGPDPTLAIYAAYACSDADIESQIQSIHKITRNNLGLDLFDVAMLAGALVDSRLIAVPFCPILTQGWSLLRIKNVRLSQVVQQAHENIVPALWTTFDTVGASKLASALAAGDIL